VSHPWLEATESIGVEPAKERRGTRFFGFCRGWRCQKSSGSSRNSRAKRSDRHVHEHRAREEQSPA
jgi:hypothetical protein